MFPRVFKIFQKSIGIDTTIHDLNIKDKNIDTTNFKITLKSHEI